MLVHGFKKLLAFVACASILPSVFSKPINPRQTPADVAAALYGYYAGITPTTTLTWHACLPGLFCAVLDVPLDYANPSSPRAALPLIKYPATTTPYKGMVFINPGGPGTSAVVDVAISGSFYATTIGTNFDIVAYEPRGIGLSTPSALCGPTSLKKRVFHQPHGPRLPTEFYQEAFAFGQGMGTACSAAIGGPNDAGKYMSTAVVGRDAISVLDVYAASGHSNGVANKTLFNFWAVSYGTIIGQTFAMLFPTRVGRFVLDGVSDAQDWYSGKGQKVFYLADRAFSSFFTSCSLAAPGLCSFATGTTSQDVHQRFETIVLQLNAKKAYQQNWANKTELLNVLEAIKVLSTGSITAPKYSFTGLADFLSGVDLYLQGLISYAVIEPSVDVFNYHYLDQFPSFTAGVLCTDTGGVFFGKTLAQLQSQINTAENQSWIAGEVFATPKAFTCTTWSISGVGRYTGDFGGNTQTPILFVSNTVDPITPMPNGVKAKLIFNGAKLLTVDAIGHTSWQVANGCAFAKIGVYFQGGAPSNSFCDAEPGAFDVTVSGSAIVLKRGETLFSKKTRSIFDK